MKQAFVPSSGASQSAQLTKIEKPTSAPPTPVLKGNSSSSLTNKNSKPSYSSKPTAPAANQPPKKPSKPANNTPKNGEVRNGKTYDPDFGWIDGTGGGVGTTVDGDWGGGEQVGIMD